MIEHQQCPALLFAREAAPQPEENAREDRQRHEQLHSVPQRGAVIVGEVVLRDRLQPAGERPAADPLRAVAALGHDQGNQREAHERHRRDGRDRPQCGQPPFFAGAFGGRGPEQQPKAHRRQHEEREVVRRQRQRAGRRERSPGGVAWGRAGRAESTTARAPPRRRTVHTRAPPGSTTRSSGFTATNSAVATATRRPASSRPTAHATGTVAMPASAESRRSATSPVPSTRVKAHSSTYHTGGEFSVCATECSVAPRLPCRTCTGVNASSYQRLCEPSVGRRSAAASRVRAASGSQRFSFSDGTKLRSQQPRSIHSAPKACRRAGARAGSSRRAPRGARAPPVPSSPGTAAVRVLGAPGVVFPQTTSRVVCAAAILLDREVVVMAWPVTARHVARSTIRRWLTWVWRATS